MEIQTSGTSKITITIDLETVPGWEKFPIDMYLKKIKTDIRAEGIQNSEDGKVYFELMTEGLIRAIVLHIKTGDQKRFATEAEQVRLLMTRLSSYLWEQFTMDPEGFLTPSAYE